MYIKRAAIAIIWVYSAWVMGGVAEFFIGTPAALGLALGIAGAVFFGVDPMGMVWKKPEEQEEKVARPIAVEAGGIPAEAPARS